MAFLDNSGDIILDAVLTELGRQRLADPTAGSSQITKFGLGDDEINYGTYDLAHPSGSAYYDLEIMQTPIFEATTSTQANIDYGLLKITNTSLLYLPVINMNEGKAQGAVKKYHNMVYLMANDATRAAAADSAYTSTTIAAADQMIQGNTSTPFIVYESGLDTFELTADATNRSDYIVATDMADTSFTILADSRFIMRVGTLKAGQYFRNTSDNQLEETLSLAYVSPAGVSQDLDNYNSFTCLGITNNIVEPNEGNDNDLSAIKGPRGTVGGTCFTIPNELTTPAGGSVSRLFTQYGTTNSAVLGGSKYYFDYIDTTVYVVGDKSSATMQIPVRILRLNRTT